MIHLIVVLVELIPRFGLLRIVSKVVFGNGFDLSFLNECKLHHEISYVYCCSHVVSFPMV